MKPETRYPSRTECAHENDCGKPKPAPIEPVFLFVNFLATPETRGGLIRGLKRAGFMRFDTNTYFRPTAPAKADEVMAAVEAMTPRAASVRVMRITDTQWTSAKVFIGKDKS